MTYPPKVDASLRKQAAEIIARYPEGHARSGLIPMLHLVQSEDGYVSRDGIALCAEMLDMTQPEVSAVATFYTQFKRHPNGEYNVGVCTNALCGVLGGDQIFEELSEELKVGHDETTADGKITLERIECNAACDFAPVIMVNWEFFDNQTPQSAKQLVEDIQAGRPVKPSRGPDQLHTFKEIEHTLAGFPDGLVNQGPSGGPATFQGLKVAAEHDWTAPTEVGAEPKKVAAKKAPAKKPAAKKVAASKGKGDK